MSLKGSKTEENLKAAFAGESQANRRYLYFAQKADVEGYNDVSAVFRSTIVQLAAPDELRGRVSSIHILVVTSGPRLGDIEAAAAAAVIGAQASVISGGVLCILGVAVVARLFPELGRHVHEPAAAPPGERPVGVSSVDSG